MNWQAVGNFVVALAPYVVALLIGIGSWIWGRNALKGKDDVIDVLKQQIGAQKDLALEVRQAKDAHIQALERLRPARLIEDIDGLHEYYARQANQIQQQADATIAEIKAAKTDDKDKKELEAQVHQLRGELKHAQRTREAAEQLAASLRSASVFSGDLNLWPSLSALGHGVSAGSGVISGSGPVGGSGLIVGSTAPVVGSGLFGGSSPPVTTFGGPSSGNTPAITGQIPISSKPFVVGTAERPSSPSPKPKSKPKQPE